MIVRRWTSNQILINSLVNKAISLKLVERRNQQIADSSIALDRLIIALALDSSSRSTDHRLVVTMRRLVVVSQLVLQLVGVLDLVMRHVPGHLQVPVGPDERSETGQTDHRADHQAAVAGPPAPPVVVVELPDQISDERILQALSGQSLLVRVQFRRLLFGHLVDSVVGNLHMAAVRVTADAVTHLAGFNWI